MDRPTLWERMLRVNPYVWDSLLAAAVLVLSALPAAIGPRSAGLQEPDPRAWVLVGFACLPLAFRRRAPLVVLCVVAAATAAYVLLDHPGSLEASLAVAAYTAAASRPRREVALLAAPVALVAAIPAQLRSPAQDNWVEIVLGLTVSVGIPIMVGRIMHNRRRRLARDREQAERDAVADERTRIARELHEVVAHSMGVMVVQAGAARTVMDRDLAAAKEAIGRIEETGRAGLSEMRRLIGVLTADGSQAALAPPPTLARLDELLAGVRAAGLPVELVVEGQPRPLAAGVDLAAYRVIQESLTNVLKHAGHAHARVALRYRDVDLEIAIEDDGRGSPAVPGVGHGLIGMRERVGMFGGTLETADRPGGGFAVRATIPTEEPS